MRDFATTLAIGELSNAGSQDFTVRLPEGLSVLKVLESEWKINQTIWHAADLLNAAFVLGQGSKYVAVARFIEEQHRKAPAGILRLAKKILSNSHEDSNVDSVELDPDDALREKISIARKKLELLPHNPILWIELARLFLVRGAEEKAVRAAITACEMAPNNRFVVRSGARLFLHAQDTRLALKYLRNQSAVIKDPWLLAAEISITSATKVPSLFAKSAYKVVENDNFSEAARTELYSALATLEFETGGSKRARRLFEKSLIEPNENSLAQAQWVRQLLPAIRLTEPKANVVRRFEADARAAVLEGNYDVALDNGKKWFKDQPFSKRAALFTSYLSSTVEKYENSIQILKSSLRANRRNAGLINNLAFALGSLGRVSEAQEWLSKLDPSTIDASTDVALRATSGLLAFRRGLTELGRLSYRDAIEKAGRLGFKNYEALAKIFLAREEILARTNEASSALKNAQIAADPSPYSDVRVTWGFLLEALRKSKLSSAI